jgi:hypothetical protein
MAVTIDKFELVPGQAPAEADKPPPPQGDGAAPPPPSRHDLLRAVRQELSRIARVRAH